LKAPGATPKKWLWTVPLLKEIRFGVHSWQR
jgi:hypothetical protein